MYVLAEKVPKKYNFPICSPLLKYVSSNYYQHVAGKHVAYIAQHLFCLHKTWPRCCGIFWKNNQNKTCNKNCFFFLFKSTFVFTSHIENERKETKKKTKRMNLKDKF